MSKPIQLPSSSTKIPIPGNFCFCFFFVFFFFFCFLFFGPMFGFSLVFSWLFCSFVWRSIDQCFVCTSFFLFFVCFFFSFANVQTKKGDTVATVFLCCVFLSFSFVFLHSSLL